MLKPTSFLNFEIIKFLRNDPQITNLLGQRDSNPNTMGIEITCKFYQNNSNDTNKSAYMVDFVYQVRNVNLEQNDDVSVLVEVTDGNPVMFKVLNVRFY